MANIFRGGVPYRVEVLRLNDAFPVPGLTEGRVIKHEDLAGVISSKKGRKRKAAHREWLLAVLGGK